MKRSPYWCDYFDKRVLLEKARQDPYVAADVISVLEVDLKEKLN